MITKIIYYSDGKKRTRDYETRNLSTKPSWKKQRKNRQMVLWREQRNTTEMARDRYKAFSEEETGETKTKSKRVWKKYRKIMSEEDKQRKKEYMKD